MADKRTYDSTCLVHHIASLPVPAALLTQAALYYKWAKQYRLANYTFGLAEETLQAAYDTSRPVRNILDKPIGAASVYAVKKLEGLEQSYPAIKMTPQEILDEAKVYVENSKIKRGVDAIISVKDYGEKKIVDTKEFCTGIVSGVVQTGQQSAANVLRTGMVAVNGVMDVSENLIDTYVVPEGKHLEVQQSADGTMVDRVTNIYGKLSYGVKERATTSMQMTYEMAMDTLNQIRATKLMLQNFNQLSTWAKEHSGAALTQVQQTLMDLMNKFSAGAKIVGKNPFTIDFVRFLTGGSELAMARLMEMSQPYLTDRMMEPLKVASTYVHSVNQTVNEADNLTDLKDELIIQARERFAEVEDVVIRVVDMAASLPSKITINEEKVAPMRMDSIDSDESNSSMEA